MAARLAPPPAREQSRVKLSWLNRRVAVRFPCGRKTSGRFSLGRHLHRARIHDLSVGGMALLLRRPLRAGRSVLIQLKNDELELAYDLAASVAHSTKKSRTHWLVGLAFARELTETELRNLL